MTALIAEVFLQVSRDIEEGASGPEASNVMLHRLMTHFVSVDTGEGYTSCIVWACARGRRFAIFAGRFA